MKLMDLISEKVNIEKSLQSEIDELGELSKQIDKIKEQLKPLQKRYGEVVNNVIPVIDKLDKETITTNNFVMRILRKGYERETFQYKEGFLVLLQYLYDE